SKSGYQTASIGYSLAACGGTSTKDVTLTQGNGNRIDGFASRIVNGVHESIPVFIRRVNDDGPIDSTAPTLMGVHGRGSSFTEMLGITNAVAVMRPSDQVLVLDWSSAGAEEGWIQPVGEWAAKTLFGYGFRGSNLNLIGHSWGSYVADELAELMPFDSTPGSPYKVNSIVALDPGADDPLNASYNVNVVGTVDFARVSNCSWAFHTSRDLGNEYTPTTASEAFVVLYDNVWVLIDTHNKVKGMFAYMIQHPAEDPSKHFKIDRLVTCQRGPWMLNGFTSAGSRQTGGGYEGKINVNAAGLPSFEVVPYLLDYEPLPTLGSFSKVFPTDGSTGQPTSLTASWGLSEAALVYEYCLSTVSSCAAWTSVGAATNVVVNGLATGTTYFWQVRARVGSIATDANAGLWWTFKTAAPLPDLAVSVLSTPPGVIAPSASFTVTDTTVNQGGGVAGASTTRYRLSTDSTITTADPLLTGTRSVPSLSASGSSSGSVTVTIPSGTVPGNYYVGACADDLGTVTESAESNNCRASATTVSVTSPMSEADLVVTALTVPASGTVGISLAGMSVTVKNQAAIAAGAYRLGFYFSTSPTYSTSAVYSGSYCGFSNGIAAGASQTCSGSINVPASLSPGGYYVIAYADDQAQVTEANEANNWLAATTGMITLAAATAKPDLLVTALTAPTNGTVGGSLAGMSVTVKNQAVIAAGAYRLGFYFSTSPTY
ncbi:MAG: CARDB domain-containing protein, partial [Acidobacteriota bacterium]